MCNHRLTVEQDDGVQIKLIKDKPCLLLHGLIRHRECRHVKPVFFSHTPGLECIHPEDDMLTEPGLLQRQVKFHRYRYIQVTGRVK